MDTPQPANNDLNSSPTTPPINYQPDKPTDSETKVDQKDFIQQTVIIITIMGLVAFAMAFLLFRKIKNNEKTSNDIK